MEIRNEYLEKYLYDIAVEQLTADYKAKGYQVSKQDTVGKYHPDLTARKDDEVIVFEVKIGKMTPEKRKQVAAIGDYVRSKKNYKLLVVVATPPKQKRIDIPNLEQLLFDHLVNDAFPENLIELSSRTRITDVPDVTVDEVIVNEDRSIIAKGNGTVEVELQYGPNNDDGAITEDAFPFNFEIILKYDEHQELAVSNAKTIEVDTSSFYE